ncbi:glycerate kinase [Bacillus pacificus]|uniref:glycerate kinase n=1 Tax=Bacillus TaxID=1386 RepID=UPI00034DEF8D|nr:glycerate kinase [Bacillus pacificus]MCC2417032.1 glycerate kinase [Bacillus pacificus]MCU5004188.1 glycerate kinase [Bacillus pacificus]MCU5254945.1 glycerate kinase [Bacillus pacificus]MCU5561675.1 glycerate kinase [Bacillus pacificus]
MRILVVPSGFKESLGAKEAADVMKEGILKVMPLATVETLPMVDGGEGFTEAIINITGGKMYNVQVTGPVGDEIQSYFGIFETRNGERTAVIEMALQKVQGEIKHTILEKRNEIEVFVITVETNDKQSKVVEIEKTTGQIQLLEKPMTKITEEQAKEIAVQQVPGNVKRIRLEQKNEKNIYVIEIEKSANENVIVEIEENTGAFIGTSQIQKVITEEQAKEVALQKVQGGSIEKVSIVDINGMATYQIIIKKQTETVDVRVHTITGEIISTTSVNNAIQQKESSQQQDEDDQEEGNDDQEDDDEG